MTRHFLAVLAAAIAAIVATDLARWHINDMWAPRGRR